MPNSSREPLLHNLHVQEAQKPHPKPKAQRRRRLRFKLDCGIVEAELFQRLPQVLKLAGVHRIKPCKDHRLHFPEALEGFCRRPIGLGDRIAHLDFADVLDACHDVPYGAARDSFLGFTLEPEDTDFFHGVLGAGWP
ncbi:MAG: hypothetical protein KatS3mg026_1323 [Bacteroidia bacterium]|nr:MAG: hypothetical protein KatS3mg026_1323 [Bacteroidia bacterium]